MNALNVGDTDDWEAAVWGLNAWSNARLVPIIACTGSTN